MVAPKLFAGAIHLWLVSCVFAVCLSCSGATPAVVITNFPAYGSTSNLQGCVLGADPATQAVAVFIYVPGYGWVTKPTCAQPLTTIQTNGAWSANIVTGSGDTNATRVAALLVGTNYNQPCVDGTVALSTNIYALASAKTVVTRPSPGVRFLSFSGYDWSVKNSTGLVGPGPNYFSDSTTNVWIDTNGWLHLRITHRSSAWQCAEIISARTFGAGNYRFELGSPADAINTNVTLGLFTWSDDLAFVDREIDVECGRWNNPADTDNSQFVVQPYDSTNHLVRYRVPAVLTNSTHLFIWETNRVSFQAQSNSYTAIATNAIYSWVFTNAAAVPQSGDECVHLNLWLFQGHPPTDNNEVEVVVKSFTFVPLGATPVAVLGNAKLSGQFQCTLAVQPDFRYQIQVTTNLFTWTNLTSLLATNGILNFADTNAATRARFYRAVTQP